MRTAEMIGALLGVISLTAGPAAAAGADCRRIPVFSAACFSERSAPSPKCRQRPYASAPCFTVRGRLAVFNGAPSFRLLPRGSRRVLGVFDGDGDEASQSLLPSAVEELARPPAPGSYRDVYGDFQVCPLASERAGWMRPVCIVGASDLSLTPPPPSAARSARRSPAAPG